MYLDRGGELSKAICALTQLEGLAILEHLPSSTLAPLVTLGGLSCLSLHICDQDSMETWPAGVVPLESPHLTRLAICGGGTVSVRRHLGSA